jgi:flagellar hook-associated protein 3 FlgL
VKEDDVRVTFNTSFRESNHTLSENAAELARRQREVSSGLRLHAPSDDPAAAAAVSGERTELAVTDRYQQAADSVVSRLSVVDVVLTTLIDQTTAAKVAAMSARGSTQTESQRDAAAEQLLSIRDAVLSAVNTQYRGTYLFSGNDATTAPWIDSTSGYQGSATVIEVDVDRQAAIQVAFDGQAVLGGAIEAGQPTNDLLTILDELAVAARTGDAQGLTDGIAELGTAFDRLTRTQSRVGSDLAAIDTQRLQLGARKLAGQTRVSTLEDANMAESISAMNRADTAYRAALGATSKTNQLSLMDYLQ